jgi:hypothetical protein
VEGSDNITYLAKDNAGNTQSAKSLIVKIDKTKPTININSPQAKEYFASEDFTLNFAATDALSGMSSIQATLNGGPVNNGQACNLSTMDGSYSVTVQAKDKADNSVSKSVAFTVKSAKALKRGTIDKLNSAKTGDKKKDENVERVISLINDSLDSKLWVDTSHLVYGPTSDWLQGLRDRFDKEKKTLDDEDMDDDAKGKTITNPIMSKIVTNEIGAADREFSQAMDAAGRGQSAVAVTRFSHAWLHAQLVMKFATMEVPQPPPKIEPKDNGDKDQDKDKDNKK